jgi:uncharacterized membrane protein (DUF4010 family)
MFIFNQNLGILLLPYFIILILISSAMALLLYIFGKPSQAGEQDIQHHKNPLELKIASIFAILFIVFSLATYYTIHFYGNSGLNVLSYVVGFTDIDPYLLNLFQGKYQIEMAIIGRSTLQAIISNNILKIIYTITTADKVTKKLVMFGLGLITIVNILIMIFI